MQARILTVTLLSAGLTLGSLAPATAAPPATKYQTTLTTPSSGASPTIKITRTSKASVKASGGNVTFQLKLNGVTDAADLPVNNTNNTFQVDVVVAGTFTTMNFSFDLIDGKTDNTQTKFTLANSLLPGSPMAGDPIEVVSARVIKNGEFQRFGTSGITAK